jgi:hypothetical protein
MEQTNTTNLTSRANAVMQKRRTRQLFPEIKKHLEKYSFGDNDEYWTTRMNTIAYLETDKYKIAAIKIGAENYSSCGGGTQISKEIKLVFQDKNTLKLEEICTENLVVRDRFNAEKDLPTDYWLRGFLDMKINDEDKVTVELYSDHRKYLMEYTFNLKEKTVTRPKVFARDMIGGSIFWSYEDGNV